jgi:S-adenosyl-L-methionine hydrolase (adenosine-forming)
LDVPERGLDAVRSAVARTQAVLITLTTDFGKQSQGVGMMEAVIAEIAPQARVVHYMHGLEDYNTMSAARVLETVQFIMPAIHVCVCDPGVGTARRPLAILTSRGDVLVGPDNGVLLPAAVVLGGAVEARQITNPAVMRHPVSAVFHGRDVFCSAAAHLANGLSFELVGGPVDIATLAPAPFTDATRVDDGWSAQVIHVDKFGNAHLNISLDDWRSLAPPERGLVDVVIAGGRRVAVEHRSTFGDVSPGAPVVLVDNDGRPALAVNRGSFAATYAVSLGDDVVVEYEAPPRPVPEP